MLVPQGRSLVPQSHRRLRSLSLVEQLLRAFLDEAQVQSQVSENR